MGYLNKWNRQEETITIAQYGTAGYVNWQKEKFWANDVCFSVYPNKEILKRYLYHFLLKKQEYLYSISNKTAVPYSISREKILRIKILIPPIEVQEHVVSVLDKFDDLVQNTLMGIPKEIELRQKQYKYYREKLLSFKR